MRSLKLGSGIAAFEDLGAQAWYPEYKFCQQIATQKTSEKIIKKLVAGARINRHRCWIEGRDTVLFRLSA
jgi:hypothetical protein